MADLPAARRSRDPAARRVDRPGQRCRLAPFVKLAKTITAQRAGILAAIEHGLSNAHVEAINTRSG